MRDERFGIVVSPKKNGTNFVEDNTIRRMAREGHSAETISDELQIALPCVESVVEQYLGRKDYYDELAQGPKITRLVPEESPEPDRAAGEKVLGTNRPKPDKAAIEKALGTKRPSLG